MRESVKYLRLTKQAKNACVRFWCLRLIVAFTLSLLIGQQTAVKLFPSWNSQEVREYHK